MAHNSTSSPDPLASDYADDFSSNSPSKPSRTSTNTSTKQCARSSNCIQNKAIDLSPSKIMTEQVLSPWRIRVTVEAEPDDEEQTVHSRGGRTRTVTHTMKVPLQSEEASSPTKPRKSSPARVKKSKRWSVTDLDALVLGDDAEEDEWCAKPKSPRKRRGSKNKISRNSRSNGEADGSGTFNILEDTQVEDVIPGKDQQLVKDDSPELRQIDLNQVALRVRKNSTTNKEAGDDSRKSTNNARQTSISSVMSYPTPLPTASEPRDFDQSIPAEVPAEQEVGLQTIMESEGFTMIDLDSLSALKNLRSSPQDMDSTSIAPEFRRTNIKRDGTENTPEIEGTVLSAHSSTPSIDDTAVTSDIASSPPSQSSSASAKTYSIGHLQLPSSLRIHRHRHVTPLPPASEVMRSSPPPLPRATPAMKSSIPYSKKAVEAGIALRDAVTPEPEFTTVTATAVKDQRSEENTIFGGFSSGTRRELRADLRFGEELGTRQVEQRHLANDKTLTPSTNDQNSISTATENTAKISEIMGLSNQARWNDRWQEGRDEVIRQAEEHGSDQVIFIESDQEEHDHENSVNEEDTMGDIWLAEAKNALSSPMEAEERQSQFQPRRKLIPSPWKRGEETVDNASSYLSGDETMSGLLWRTLGTDGNVRFGDEVLAHPDRYSSRARQFSDTEKIGDLAPTHAQSCGHQFQVRPIDEDENEQAICWRSAQDVVDEETEIFERKKGQTMPKNQQSAHQDESVTNLYEMNLGALPEQDLLSPSQMKSPDQSEIGNVDHDSTYSSISDAESIAQQYLQRTSLSPSKERLNTPRSAMKGGRASFGQALMFDGFEEEKKRVVWAKKAACVNELWEESSRSIRSTQDSSIDETPTPIAEEKHAAIEGKLHHKITPAPRAVANLDGSPDASIDPGASENKDAKYPPLAHVSPFGEELADVREPQRSQIGLVQSLDSEVGHSGGSSELRSQDVPSYLKPPSYPSIPDRDISQPLATAGHFSNTHFRTLHILYKKSQRPRFHAPQYPDDIRPAVRTLVESNWRLVVDESQNMGERFTFSIGVAHARVIERFMQEIEWDWERSGLKNPDLEWGWSTEQLATWLGRIIVGEAVRADEKAPITRD